MVFAPVAGPPSVSDLERGKRTGSIADFRDFVRLSQAFDVVHVCAQTTEPQDVSVNERHIETALAQLTLTRYREFIREPEAVFWALVFPILLTTGLGIAFRNQPDPVEHVAVVAPALLPALAADKLLAVETMTPEAP